MSKYRKWMRIWGKEAEAKTEAKAKGNRSKKEKGTEEY